jgi:molybdopterin converting factor small subunit
VRRSLLLFVGDRPVRPDEAAQLPLKDNDRVVLLPPISGG